MEFRAAQHGAMVVPVVATVVVVVELASTDTEPTALSATLLLLPLLGYGSMAWLWTECSSAADDDGTTTPANEAGRNLRLKCARHSPRAMRTRRRRTHPAQKHKTSNKTDTGV